MLSHENTHTVHMKSQRSQSSFNLRLWSSPIATSNVNESDARVAPADVGSMTGGNGALFRDITAYDNYSSSSSITRLNRSPLPLADDPSGRHAFSSSGQRLRTPTLTSTTATTTTTSNSLSSNQNNYSNHKPPNFKQVANSLHKSNSRSVFNLYSPNVGSPNSHPFSSNVDHLAAQSTSRKGSIALKNILLDRLLSKPSTSSTHDSSSLHHISHSNPSRPWSTNTGSSPSTASSFGKLVHRLQYGSNSTFELRSTETRKSMGDSDSVGSNNAHHHLQQPDSGLGRTDSERSSGSKIVLHQQKSHQPQKKKNKKSNKKDVHLMRSHSLNDLHALPPESNEADFNWKRYGDAYQAEIRKRRHEMYITEIEMDSVMQTGPTLRAIYDGDEYEKFIERLDQRIKSHDKDIERMCNAHYQGFVDCIHELLKVRPQSEQLKRGVIEINQEIQKSSENIQRKAEELIRFRRILCNTEATIEHLSICLPVLDTYSKLLQQMKEDKYYLALKTLEQLETVCFPRVERYEWAQAMICKIPQVRDHIKNASMSDLKDFLETIRKQSAKIGQVAMRNAALQQNMDDTVLNCLSNQSTISGLSRRSNKKRSPLDVVDDESELNTQNDEDDIQNRRDDMFCKVADGLSTAGTDREDEELSATDLVDFSPVYRCLHIYTCLGARETFEHYYRQQRQQQAKLALQAPMNMHETLQGYRNYFTGIVGFFVIEDHILSTGNGLVTKEYLDAIWQNSLQSIVASLRTHSSYCTDARLMLHIKRIVILFIYTLQSYGYNVNQLFRLLVEIRDQYNEILMKQWVTVFRNIFEADNYHPMVVHNIKELNDLLMEFPFYEVEALNLNGLTDTLDVSSSSASLSPINKVLQDDDTDRDVRSDASESSNSTATNVSISQSHPPHRPRSSKRKHHNNHQNQSKGSEFPKKFPFSSFVPKVFREVKQFIHACLEFSADLNSSQSEIEDMVRKSTNILLTRTLSGCLSSLIKKPNLGLLQLIQITINTNYLEEASVYLEEYISKTIGNNYSNLFGAHSASVPNAGSSSTTASGGGSGSMSKLQGKSMFKDARADAESQIYMQLNQKIDEFLELATYDWMIVESNGLASVYISDLIAFLRSTFEAFTNLPLKVAQTACHSACKHIASSLMCFLMDEEVKCVSMGALTQFNLDLLQCEMFAGSEPVRGFEDGDLIMCFAELRQLMDLFMLWDWNIYFADFGKQHSKYLRVNPNTALNLLEKIREADRKKNLFISLKKNERDKKRLTDIVIKQLKQLAIGSGTAT